MINYWNDRFKTGTKVWGEAPSGTAQIASELFKTSHKRQVLVIGSGYGRNSNLFYNEGFDVIGIEYAEEGVKLARAENPMIEYIHGSVFDLPLSGRKFSAIYCYNVIHLFLKDERDALIKVCENILLEDGLMFFSAFSDEDLHFGLGVEVEDNTFTIKKGKLEHYFSKKELREMFSDFSVIKEGNYEEIIGERHCKLRYLVVATQ